MVWLKCVVATKRLKIKRTPIDKAMNKQGFSIYKAHPFYGTVFINW